MQKCRACEKAYDPTILNKQPTPYLPQDETWAKFHSCVSCLHHFIDTALGLGLPRCLLVFESYAPIARKLRKLDREAERDRLLGEWAHDLMKRWKPT